MQPEWFEVMLFALGGVVLCLITAWAWEEFRDWRLHRAGPRGRRHPGA